MNKFMGIGRLTADPEVRYTQGEHSTCVAWFTLACDRKFKREGEPTADFIRCKAFGKTAEFVEKYFRKGVKYAAIGTIQTGSYKNKEGQTVYTTDVLVEEVEFVESKNSNSNTSENTDGFKNVADGIDEELPFA